MSKERNANKTVLSARSVQREPEWVGIAPTAGMEQLYEVTVAATAVVSTGPIVRRRNCPA